MTIIYTGKHTGLTLDEITQYLESLSGVDPSNTSCGLAGLTVEETIRCLEEDLTGIRIDVFCLEARVLKRRIASYGDAEAGCYVHACKDFLSHVEPLLSTTLDPSEHTDQTPLTPEVLEKVTDGLMKDLDLDT